jgi:hypothetical protein
MLTALALAGAVVLFGAVLGFLELGRRLGERWRQSSGSSRGHAAVEGAVFALMGLLIAFTFSAAQERLDARRRLLIDEANAIGTAYLRIELLPAQAQPELRDDFRAYAESRIAESRLLASDRSAARAQRARGLALGKQIWLRATAAVRESPNPVAPLSIVPAINEMLDLENARFAAQHIHAPATIFALLIALGLACALFAGLGMGRNEIRSNFYLVAFATALTITLLVIVDMEFPRVGLIRIDALDALLADARASMN